VNFGGNRLLRKRRTKHCDAHLSGRLTRRYGLEARQYLGVALRIVGPDQPGESPCIEYLGDPALRQAALVQSFRQRAKDAKRARFRRNGTDRP
jgi:hypothetical protein